jgi:YggT family protein
VLTQILTAAIFFRAILSWFQMDPRNPLIAMLDQITEPILAPLRRVVPRLGMIDITPLVAIILLQVIAQAVIQSL